MKRLDVTWVQAAVCATVLVACGGGEEAPRRAELVLPDLTAADPAVRSKIENLHRSATTTPSVASLGAYARTLHAHGMFALAEEAYLAAADAEISGPAKFAMVHLAGVAASDVDLERAVEHFKRAAGIQSNYAATFLNQAVFEERLGRFDDAARSYEAALALEPSSHAHLGLGRLALAAGDAQGALRRFGQALEVNPQHWEVHEARSRALAKLGQKEASRAAAAAAEDGSQPTLFRDDLIGAVLAEDVTFGRLVSTALQRLTADQDAQADPAKLEDALRRLDLALLARPQAVEPLFYRAITLARLKRNEMAIEAFEKVIAVDPRHQQSLFYLAGLLHGEKRGADARPHLDALLAANADHKEGLAMRASILLEAGDRTGAQADLRALLNLDPDNKWAKDQLAK